MNNAPGTGGAAAAGAAEGPGWVCRGHGPSGLWGPGRCLGAVAVMGPAPSKRGDMGRRERQHRSMPRLMPGGREP